jgi:DNA-directed RNA polymerase subunit beta'
MVLGIYYLTLSKDEDAKPKHYFLDFKDAITAHEAGVVDLHTKILVRDEKGEKIETTIGRILFNEAVKEAVLGS